MILIISVRNNYGKLYIWLWFYIRINW